MRPHNSGHWSIEGATTNQFEQHLRAVLDWPLGDIRPRARVTVMVNVLGGPSHRTSRRPCRLALARPRTRPSTCTARASGPGRKLGHVTVLGDDLVEARDRARRAVAILRG